MKTNPKRGNLKNIRLVIFDVDGVLTDGAIFLNGAGEELKRFHVHDGTGIRYLERAGIRTAILSGRRARATTRRAAELGIHHVQQGCKRKLDGLARIMRAARLPAGNICFVGDDLPDIPVLQKVGFAVAVADARPEVIACAHWVTRARGGYGAARELAEKLLKAQGKWKGIIGRYGLTADAATGEDS